jgi:hypothetical protein
MRFLRDFCITVLGVVASIFVINIGIASIL